LLQIDAAGIAIVLFFEFVAKYRLDILGVRTVRVCNNCACSSGGVFILSNVLSGLFAQFSLLAVHFFQLSPSLTLPSVALNVYPSAVLRNLPVTVCSCITVLVSHSVDVSALQPDAVCVLLAVDPLGYVPNDSTLFRLRLT
jgi:hypothetical protein